MSLQKIQFTLFWQILIWSIQKYSNKWSNTNANRSAEKASRAAWGIKLLMNYITYEKWEQKHMPKVLVKDEIYYLLM